ncbi:sensor histidine kinase [Clostridium sp.]|uniref:sensor histidine kinase n=1 Tax=Clostridium sp. TaxID=1506 RepID=UPI00261FA730|nr:sensor histidine kinase [Clostridium sp.]
MEKNIIYEIINSFIGVFMPVYFINKMIPSNNKTKYILYSCLTFILYILILISSYNYSINIYLQYSTCIIPLSYLILSKEGSLWEKIFCISFYISGMSIILAICITEIELMKKFGVVLSVKNIFIQSFWFMMLVRSLDLIFIYIVSKSMDFLKYISGKMLLMLSIVFIGNAMIADFIVEYTVKGLQPSGYFFIVISLGLLFIQIATFYILNTISKIIEEKFILEVKLKSKQNDEDIMRMHKEIRGWRHDMRNHVNTVLGLLERNQLNKAIEYIHEIDKVTSEFEKLRYTDNIAVDSILSSKINLAKEKGVEIGLELNVSSEIKLSNVEICTLLGNLLDNSIEACEKVEKNKFITLKILGIDDKLIIRIRNSTNGSLKEVGGIFKTTKIRGMHGIGLSQIDSVVEKYGGYIKRVHENNIFDTAIMINY